MQKMLVLGISTLAATMLLGNATAQTPAASTPSTSGQASAPAKPAAPSTTKKTPASTKAFTPFTLKTKKEKTSYAVGVNIGTGLKRQELPVDPAILARGIRDAMTGSKLALTDEEMKAVLTELSTEMRAKQAEFRAKQEAEAKQMEAKAHEAGLPNRKEGETFLAANKSKEGVVALPDGLQYKILTEGSGPKPKATDTVTCNYKGTLLSGKEFDSSEKHGGAASFPLDRVIKGWTEALQLMPVGSKWQLFIPADLAYGDTPPPGGDIQPGDTLIFEVELLKIGEDKK